MPTLLDDMPAVYRDLLPKWFERQAPDESKATCASCAMCAPAEASPADPGVFFSPDVKCCSYHPTLPNYLVGGILEDQRPELQAGRDRILAKITSRVGVTPRWLAAPARYLLLHGAARDSSFGRSPVLLCPYYQLEGGTCAIWPYREAVCSTFFCKFDAGDNGRVFWDNVKRYFSVFEATLSEHVIAELGSQDMVDLPTNRRWLTREELEDTPPSDADYQTWWRAWEGKEAELYRQAYQLISALSREEVERLVVPRLEVAFEALQTSLDVLADPKLPERLRCNTDMRVVDLGDSMCWVNSYRRYDPQTVPAVLVNALTVFDGERSTEEAVGLAASQYGVALSPDLLLSLWELRFLLAVG